MYKTYSIRVNTETETVNLFLNGTKDIVKDGYCDIGELAENIESVCNDYEKNGYEVISILPIIRGEKNYRDRSDGSYGWGYSVTDGVIITFKSK